MRVDQTTVPVLNRISVSFIQLLSGAQENEYHLFQAFPNPSSSYSSGYTAIYFQLPLDGDVKVTIYDITGREVSTLMDMYVVAGVHNTHISDMKPGVYFVRVESGPWSDTCSFVVTE